MSVVVGLVWLLAAKPQGEFTLPTYEVALRERAALRLVSERATYSVHEALRLRLILKNTAAPPLRGIFMLGPSTWHSEIFFRHASSPFVRLGTWTKTVTLSRVSGP
jgi:hypothetical protein